MERVTFVDNEIALVYENNINKLMQLQFEIYFITYKI